MNRSLLLAAAASTASLHAQTVLGGGFGATWTNAGGLSTGSGLTLSLGLGLEYLIVGGGGGGGNGWHGAGGGGGGMLEGSTIISLSNQSVTVGAGGLAGGNNGGNSSAFGLTALGGGGGANGGSGAGKSGGSGGGASYVQNASGSSAGGAGTSGQGNTGGTANYITGVYGSAAGGGGAGGAGGTSGSGNTSGVGGSGRSSSITGAAVTYAGGGGGNGGNGGSGGGGSSGGAGTDGLGGGGGGPGGPVTAGRGGSGVVVVRYIGSSALATGGTTSSTSVSGSTRQVVRFGSSGTLAFTATAANLVASHTGVISGSGALTYDSPGTLTLAAANTFTGTTFAKAGTLNLGHASALQSSTLDLRAADSGSIGFALAGANAYNLGGLAGSRGLAFGANTLVVGGNNADTSYSGALSGTGGLRKAGSGTLTLAGANFYSGGTEVAAGTLALGASETLHDAGNLTVSGGTLDLGGNTETVAAVTMTGGVLRNGALIATGVAATAGTIEGALTGGAVLTKTGAGELVLRGANAHTGGTVIAAGLVRADSDGALGAGEVELGAARLRLGKGVALANNVTLVAAAADAVMDINALDIQYLVVGGGGGGASLPGAGGGGGGGGNVVTGLLSLASAQTSVVVGTGGATTLNGGASGGTSSISNPLVAVLAAGGTGGAEAVTGGTAGGSSASSLDGVAASYVGGSPNSTSTRRAGGGGAGAGGNGSNASANTGGSGGIGVASSLSGTLTYYGGGGGGGAEYANNTPTPGAGGLGGGGKGAGNTSGHTGFTAATAGAANTGGGGGGAGGVNNVASGVNGAAGGSGIVILRYAGSQVALGGDVTTVGGDTVHTFRSGASSFSFLETPTARLDGAVGGSGGFTWSSFGHLILGSTNSYAGGTVVADGGIYAAHDSSLGSGSVRITGAGARLGASAHVTLANEVTLEANGVFDSGTHAAVLAGAVDGAGSLTKVGAGILTLSSGANTYSGGTTVSEGTLRGTTSSLQGAIANSAIVQFAQDSDGTYAGVISGGGSFSKDGAGVVTLSGANSFTGGISVSAGTLATASAGRLAASNAASVAAGATLRLGGDQTLSTLTGAGTVEIAAGSLTLGAGNGNFAGALTGGGNLIKSGAGTLTLSGSNTFTGDVTVSGGTLVLDSNDALNAANDVTLTSGATINVAAGRALRVNSFTLTNGTLGGLGTLEALSTTVQSATIEAVIDDAQGQASDFVKTGAGTTTVNAANTFTGVVDVQGGVVELGANGSFAAASSLKLVTGSTLRLAGRSQTFAALNGTAGTVDLGTGGFLAVAGTGTFGGSITGAGSLAKSGPGRLNLTGTHTYTGATSVTGGTLSVNGSVASDVTVFGGALGGSGTIAGAVTIQSGGTLAPGNSPGILATGDLTLEGLLDVEISGLQAGATGYDQTQVTGTVTLGATAQLGVSLLNGFEPEKDALFFLISNDGTDAVTGTFSGLDQGETFVLGGMTWQISYVANYLGEDTQLGMSLGTFTGGNDVALVAVPEPSTYALGLAALLLAAAARRRVRRV